MVTRVLVFILFWSVAEAQTFVARADLMRLADRSVRVEVARAAVQSAEAQAVAVGLGLSGSVSGSAGLAGVAPSSGDVLLSYPWNFNLNLRFAGLWGEASEARVQAGIRLERARRALVSARVRALVQAVGLWHGLRRGLVNLEVAQLALVLASLEDAAAETRLKSGAISLNERERLGLGLELARLEVAKAEISWSGVRLQVEVLFGLSGAVALDTWLVLPELVGSGLELREDIFEARASLVLAGLQREAAQRAFLPTLNLEASVRGSAGSLAVGANQFLAVSVAYSYPVALPFGVATSFSLGLSLSIPIQPLAFSGVAAATRGLVAVQGLLETTIALARAEVTTVRSSIILARSVLTLAERSAEFMARQLERVKTRAGAGLVSILELKRAELDLLKSHVQIRVAQADLDAVLLELSSAMAFVLEVQ